MLEASVGRPSRPDGNSLHVLPQPAGRQLVFKGAGIGQLPLAALPAARLGAVHVCNVLEVGLGLLNPRPVGDLQHVQRDLADLRNANSR